MVAPGTSTAPAAFQVLPRCWVFELTFACLGRYRRLSKDYEALPETEEAWIHLAMSSLMLARLAKCPLSRHPLGRLHPGFRDIAADCAVQRLHLDWPP